MTEKEMVALLLTGQKGSDITKASIYAGRQITPRLSVGVNLGGGDRGTEFVARYRLMDHVELEGTSSARKSGASINYTFDVK
jgi:autotransporter translocation and assembly factor TamB